MFANNKLVTSVVITIDAKYRIKLNPGLCRQIRFILVIMLVIIIANVTKSD